MKKNIFVFIIFMLFSFAIYADEYVISEIDGYNLKDEKVEINFKYDDGYNIYYLQRSTYSNVYWFHLIPIDLEQLKANLAKAKEWAKIAKENKTDVIKEIPNSKIGIKATMKSGNEWYTTRKNLSLNFVFASVENGSAYSVMLYGEEEKSTQNEFIGIEFEPIYFAGKQIDDFIDAISPETIEKAKSKHQQEKKNAELFQ